MPVAEEAGEVFAELSKLIDRRFTEKIDKALSKRYIVTAALSECYSRGRLDHRLYVLYRHNLPLGGVSYKSVAHAEADGFNDCHSSCHGKTTFGARSGRVRDNAEWRPCWDFFLQRELANHCIDGQIIWGPRRWRDNDAQIASGWG